MFTIMVNDNGIGVCKSENKIDILARNEIEITEEQYEQINDFPLELTLDNDGKVIAWRKVTIEVEPAEEQPRKPTLEEEVEELKQLVADLASLQLGV